MEEEWKAKKATLKQVLQKMPHEKAARIRKHMEIAEGYVYNMSENCREIALIIAVGTYREILFLAPDKIVQDILDFAVKRAQFYAQQGHGPDVV